MAAFFVDYALNTSGYVEVASEFVSSTCTLLILNNFNEYLINVVINMTLSRGDHQKRKVRN